MISPVPYFQSSPFIHTRAHTYTYTHPKQTFPRTCLALIIHFFCLLIIFITIFDKKAREIMRHQDLSQKCEW